MESRPLRLKDLLRMARSHTQLGPQDEDIGASEQVIAILRKEGEEVPKPEDTRCHAKVGNGRCKNSITFNEEGDYWSRWCSKHEEQEATARVKGGPRVETFEGEADEDE